MNNNFFRYVNAINITGKGITDIPYLVNELNIDIDVVSSYKDWYLIDNELYYFKPILYLPFLYRELICEGVCKFLNIPTVHYKFAFIQTVNGPQYGIISRNFRSKDRIYLSSKELVSSKEGYNFNIDRILSYSTNKEEFHNEIKRLMALGIYITDIDRNHNNLYIENNNGICHIAPLFDFESTLGPMQSIYKSELFGFDFKKNNVADDFLECMIKLDLESIVYYYVIKRNLPCEKDILDNIYKHDKSAKKMINRKILTR